MMLLLMCKLPTYSCKTWSKSLVAFQLQIAYKINKRETNFLLKLSIMYLKFSKNLGLGDLRQEAYRPDSSAI